MREYFSKDKFYIESKMMKVATLGLKAEKLKKLQVKDQLIFY